MANTIDSVVLLLLAVLLSHLFSAAVAKQCTNKLPQMASHTLRAALQTSPNATWRAEMLSLNYDYHLSPTDDAVWAHLFPRRILNQAADRPAWGMAYRKIKSGAGAAVKGLLSDVPLNAVRLDSDSLYGMAQQTNLEYLLMLDVDRLVWSFRKTAGAAAPGQPYGGWEAADSELRGHFVGHYLSATAAMWAATGNATLKQKMTDVVSVLSSCQKTIGNGYLSAFPAEFFDRLEALTPVWAPYYTIHKILAGLLDQYKFAGNNEALNMTLWMVEYFDERVHNVVSKYTMKRHWLYMNEETGGMNDVLYRLYSITGNPKHLKLGYFFDKPCFQGLLSLKIDDIADFHANTHIPVVIGSQTRYEVTGDARYKDTATFFMDVINSSHTYATGGTSVHEFWSDPKRLADTLTTENEESCATYNMLKISRILFRWTKETSYIDYYERALTNGVLSIQRGRDPGVMIYMLPLGRGSSKAQSFHGWGTPNDSFWCCYGTGIESFSKLGDSIYFEEKAKVPTLYIVQYIRSSFDWVSGKFRLRQNVERVVSWRHRVRVVFEIEWGEGTSGAALNFRIPVWTRLDSSRALLNGKNLRVSTPGNFLSVSRAWRHGDNLTLEFPIGIRTEPIKDDRPEYATIQAILYGPYLLAALSNGDWEIGAKATAAFEEWISPVPSNYNSDLISLSQRNGEMSLIHTNGTLAMSPAPASGTNATVNATFRLVVVGGGGGGGSGPGKAIGKEVMLEPFDFPGSVVVVAGDGFGVVLNSSAAGAGVFNMVAGLDGRNGSVSLEAAGRKGCYISGGGGGGAVVVGCNATADSGGRSAASFDMGRGLSEYNPMSFVAKGVGRNFLLTPLMSLKDEAYTVYFNFSA
ncbi:uncharacterized protein LOC127242834 [Andrographis paniculata]|uniref:uncharacterized protein LOC127242834 n=1 Tax=Andrographis paniculata TaxID=175694 RepID=UPI0021E98CB9|nr:uncharacterized protein LOC127242834 [Andrographis paniculata]